MIAVIDLGTGNLRSVLNAFRRVGAEPRVTIDAAELSAADAIVLPGVGAFGGAMETLREQSLPAVLRRQADAGVPLLGICLGMQLLADSSEEHGHHAGLGLIPGRVARLAPTASGYRVPNIGWYEATSSPGGHPFAADAPRSYYFGHSYHTVCENPDHVALTIDYGGQPVTAAVARDNVMGVQFHPEKSQDAGLDLLADFVGLVERPQRAA